MGPVIQKAVATNAGANFHSAATCNNKDIYTGATSNSDEAHSEQQCDVEMSYFIHFLLYWSSAGTPR